MVLWTTVGGCSAKANGDALILENVTQTSTRQGLTSSIYATQMQRGSPSVRLDQIGLIGRSLKVSGDGRGGQPLFIYYIA